MNNFTYWIKNINWFYFSLIVFVISFPFGESLISISIGLLFLSSLFYIRKPTFSERLKERKFLFLVFSIYLVYLFGFLFCTNLKWGLYDLRKSMAFFFIPLSFIFGNQITKKQLKNLLLLFVLSVSVSSAVTLVELYSNKSSTILSAQESGFIHHIRFSMQLNFALIVLAVFSLFSFRAEPKIRIRKIFFWFAFGYLLLFMLWHQSFTGIITFIGTSLTGILLFMLYCKNRVAKIVSGLVLALIIAIPAIFLFSSIKKFYNTETIDFANLEKYTPDGNLYTHDTINKQIENGHYIWLYLCDDEMEPAWNRRSGLKYREITGNGYPVRETLIRYLASKGLKKDRQGIEQLNETDIQNVQAGICNLIFAQKKFSLYPRVYSSIWELDTYFKTGYANQQSISQRIEYAKAAWHIFQENLWFGVGTGNWKEAYAEAYRQIGSKMDPARYGDAHNQYLNYLVKFGISGLFWILFAIIYPVVKTRKYKNPIFLLFLASMFFANLGDSNLETHVGGAFFVFIYCLLFVADDMKFKPVSTVFKAKGSPIPE